MCSNSYREVHSNTILIGLFSHDFRLLSSHELELLGPHQLIFTMAEIV